MKMYCLQRFEAFRFFCFVCAILISTNLRANPNDDANAERGQENVHYVSPGMYVASGFVTTLTVGAGIGHAMQGRWQERGWIFTAALIGLPAAGMLATGRAEGAMVGFALWFPFHVWEVIDIWAAPTVGYPQTISDRMDYFEKQKQERQNKFHHPREYILPVLAYEL
jgi:hypothetical protein